MEDGHPHSTTSNLVPHALGESAEHIKYLGLTIQSNLIFDQHLNEVPHVSETPKRA